MLFGGIPRCARYSVPVLVNLKYCGDYAGALTAGVVATSLHPVNLVPLKCQVDPDLSARSDRLCQLAGILLSTPLHTANPAECPCLHKRWNPFILKDKG